jgi:tetratricopeptide (TPR) repeat protein
MADVKRQQKRKAAEIERLLAGIDAPEARYVRGRLRARDGKTGDAAQELASAAEGFKLANGREHVAARYHLASLHLADKRWDDARAEIARVAEHPRVAALAKELEQKERLAAPAPAPAPAATTGGGSGADLGDGPLSTDAYDGLVEKGDTFAENGNCREARRHYERALDARPGGVEALTGLGYCFLDSKEHTRALANFRAALGVSPRFGDALIGIAEAHRFSGNKDEASKYYQKYLDNHPSGPKANLARKALDALGPASPPPAPTELKPLPEEAKPPPEPAEPPPEKVEPPPEPAPAPSEPQPETPPVTP